MQLLPRALTRNWKLKLLALSMAILLWTVPRFEAQDTHVFQNVPVVVDLTDPSWAQLGDPQPSTVDVTVSGTARELLAVSLATPPVVVPLDSVGEGEMTVVLRNSWFRLPGGEGVVVEGLNPVEIRVSFEPFQRGQAVLSPRLAGTLPEGLSFSGPPEVTPPLVGVHGPASQIAGLDTIYLIPVDLARASAVRSFTPLVDTTGLGAVRVDTTEATVVIPVDRTDRREFRDMLVTLPALEPGIPLRAIPSTVTVTVVGARTLLDRLNPSEFQVTFPLAQALNLAPGQEARVDLRVEGLPSLLQRDVELNPDWVTLRRPAGL